MPGLIPLMLNPVAAGNRPSIVFDAKQKGHSRGFSTSQAMSLHSPSKTPSTIPPIPTTPPPVLSMLPEIPRRASMPPTPTAKPMRPTRQVKRLSSVAPPSLPILPYTADDWKRAIADLKRQHINRRYQVCFTRCCEILDNIKEVPNIEPAYLISLHFYAATSMDMCTRSSTGSSATYRESLIQQARAHYDQASELICQAEDSIFSRSRPSSVMSISSSLHSPSGSVSSRAWASETTFSSPTASICSSEDLNTRLQRLQMPSTSSLTRPIKKVSFELPTETAMEESFIRPDSPTLGYVDYFTPTSVRSALPVLHETEQNTDSETLELNEEDKETQERHHDERNQSPDSFIVHGHENLYCSHLSTLKAQVAHHRASLDSMIRIGTTDTGLRLHRVPLQNSKELRELDKKARIERLRKNGWQRKRFDASRYEALRMSALADLSSN